MLAFLQILWHPAHWWTLHSPSIFSLPTFSASYFSQFVRLYIPLYFETPPKENKLARSNFCFILPYKIWFLLLVLENFFIFLGLSSISLFWSSGFFFLLNLYWLLLFYFLNLFTFKTVCILSFWPISYFMSCLILPDLLLNQYTEFCRKKNLISWDKI